MAMQSFQPYTNSFIPSIPFHKGNISTKLDRTMQWYATTKSQKELHIMLDSATTCSTIPSDSYPIERKSRTGFRIYPINTCIQNKPRKCNHGLTVSNNKKSR